MVNKKPNLDLISDEKRRALVKDIISFFNEERDEEIGIIAAEEILDFFIQIFGFDLYNKGIEDSKILLKKRFDDLELDLDSLFKQ